LLGWTLWGLSLERLFDVRRSNHSILFVAYN